MTNKKKRKRNPLDHYTSKKFAPYTKAIGEVALAWNNLHETLGLIFINVCLPLHATEALAVWQSSVIDRSKRKMFEAALIEKTDDEAPAALREELFWILTRTEAIEDARNSVIHAPLANFVDSVWIELAGKRGVQGFDLLGNKKAEKLSAKDVLTEYRYCRNTLVILEKYAGQIYSYERPAPWPQRPQLPNRGQKKPRPNPRHLRVIK